MVTTQEARLQQLEEMMPTLATREDILQLSRTAERHSQDLAQLSQTVALLTQSVELQSQELERVRLGQERQSENMAQLAQNMALMSQQVEQMAKSNEKVDRRLFQWMIVTMASVGGIAVTFAGVAFTSALG